MEFSCIGDAVNLASRTEGLTKFYGVNILITEFTLAETGDAFISREVDRVVVTGKKMSVKMFELIGRKGDLLSSDFQDVLNMYANALALYRKRQFAEAAELFAHAAEITDDGPSNVLYHRSLHYSLNPPPPTWTGDYVAETK